MNQRKVKQYLKAALSPSMLDTLRDLRDLPQTVRRRLNRRNLIALDELHGNVKWNFHWYAQHYEQHFFSLRNKPLNIVEIGVGGYEDPCDGGRSLQIWSDFFPKSMVYGVDVHPKALRLGKRIKSFKETNGTRPFSTTW